VRLHLLILGLPGDAGAFPISIARSTILGTLIRAVPSACSIIRSAVTGTLTKANSVVVRWRRNETE
jgi:hypothetical protein